MEREEQPQNGHRRSEGEAVSISFSSGMHGNRSASSWYNKSGLADFDTEDDWPEFRDIAADDTAGLLPCSHAIPLWDLTIQIGSKPNWTWSGLPLSH